MIKIGDNFDYRGPNPNFARDSFPNKTVMDTTTTGIDTGHISYCQENGKYYKFNGTSWEPVIDTDLSNTSEKPVQNKAITNALNEKLDKISGTPTVGNFVAVDANGKVKDSGRKAEDFEPTGALRNDDILTEWGETGKKILSAVLGEELHTKKSDRKEIILNNLTTSINLTDGVVLRDGSNYIKLIEKTGNIALGVGRDGGDIVLYTVDLNSKAISSVKYKELRDWVGYKVNLSTTAKGIVGNDPASLIDCINELSKPCSDTRNGLMTPDDKKRYSSMMVRGKNRINQTILSGDLSSDIILSDPNHPFIGRVTSLKGNSIVQLLDRLGKDSRVVTYQSSLNSNGKTIENPVKVGSDSHWGIKINTADLKEGDYIRILARLDSESSDYQDFGLYRFNSSLNFNKLVSYSSENKDRYQWFEYTIISSDISFGNLFFGFNTINPNLKFYIEQIEIFRGAIPTSKQYVEKGLHGTRFEKLIITSYDLLTEKTPYISNYRLDDVGTISKPVVNPGNHNKVYFVPVKKGWKVYVKDAYNFGFSWIGYNTTPTLTTLTSNPVSVSSNSYMVVPDEGYLLVYSNTNKLPRAYIEGADEEVDLFHGEIDLSDIGELRKVNDTSVDSFSPGQIERRIYERAVKSSETRLNDGVSAFDILTQPDIYSTANPDHGCKFPTKYVITPVYSGAPISEFKYEVSNQYQDLMEEDLVNENSGVNEEEFVRKTDIIQPTSTFRSSQIHLTNTEDFLYAADKRVGSDFSSIGISGVSGSTGTLFDGNFDNTIDFSNKNITINVNFYSGKEKEVKNLILSFSKSPKFVPKVKLGSNYMNGEIIDGSLDSGDNVTISYKPAYSTDKGDISITAAGQETSKIAEVELIPAKPSDCPMLMKNKPETLYYPLTIPDTTIDDQAANVRSAKLPYIFFVESTSSGYRLKDGVTYSSILAKYNNGNVVIARYTKGGLTYSFYVHDVTSTGIYFSGEMDSIDYELEITASSISFKKLEKIISIKWEDLKELKDSSKLIPGQQYRIIDYETLVKDDAEEYDSAEKPFDLIVIADSIDKLNESARAIKNSEYTTIWDNARLEAWEIKYSIDNKTYYDWVDDDCKGVIYYMKDEWGNEAPYDFKNIRFYRKYSDDFTTWNIISKEGESDANALYTFSSLLVKVKDSSLSGTANNNKVGEFISSGKLKLNNVCMIEIESGVGNTEGNILSSNCYNITISAYLEKGKSTTSSSNYNTVTNGHDITILGSENSLKSGCYNVSIYGSYNSFGENCYSTKETKSGYYPFCVGIHHYKNTLVDPPQQVICCPVNHNVFGNGCSHIVLSGDKDNGSDWNQFLPGVRYFINTQSGVQTAKTFSRSLVTPCWKKRESDSAHSYTYYDLGIREDGGISNSLVGYLPSKTSSGRLEGIYSTTWHTFIEMDSISDDPS